MVKHPHDRPLFSLLLQVANPVLIIVMVASLIFFLNEIFYRGPLVFRLNVIMTLFTIATVLVSRISIEAGKQRAALFAGGLALATLATTSAIVDFEYESLAVLEPVVIIFLIVVVMWVSNRLVWDCTLLGRTRDVSAMGLLEAIRQKIVPGEQAKDRERKRRGPEQDDESFSVFEFMLGRNSKNKTPGLWVFYLAVAAFPVFGIGQFFVNPNSSGFSIFFLFAVYLTSGLGLLMVTSLLGLQRYANKRGVSVPEPVAMNWLFVGTMFLVGLMLLISLLPRPDLRSSMNDYLAFLGSEQKTSELAIGEDNDVKDQAKADPNAKPKRKPQNEEDGDQPPRDDAPVVDGERGDQADESSSEKKDGQGSEKSNSNSGDGEKNDGSSGQDKNTQNEGGEKTDQKGDNKSKKGDEGDDGKDANKEDARQDNRADAKADQAKGEPKQGGDEQEQRDARPNKVAEMERPEATPPRLSLKPDSKHVQWMLYSLVGLILLAIGIMYHEQLLRMWRQLFAGQKQESDNESKTSPEANVGPALPKPFSSFNDPFVSGMAKKIGPEKLMEYSLDAMRSWSYERGIEVSGHGTVDELVVAVERMIGRSRSDFRSFAGAFNRTIYGNLQPDSSDLESVAQIWRFMKTHSRTADSPEIRGPTVKS